MTLYCFFYVNSCEIIPYFYGGVEMQLTRGKACAFTRNDGKAGGAGGRLALLTGCGVSPQPLFSSAAEGGKTDKTGKRTSPGP